MKSDHEDYVRELKENYDSYISNIQSARPNSVEAFEKLRDKLFQELADRTVPVLEKQFPSHLEAYLQENDLKEAHDPIDALLFVGERLQSDNNWLVERLAECEEEKTRTLSMVASEQQQAHQGKVKELAEDSLQSQAVLETFKEAM